MFPGQKTLKKSTSKTKKKIFETNRDLQGKINLRMERIHIQNIETPGMKNEI